MHQCIFERDARLFQVSTTMDTTDLLSIVTRGVISTVNLCRLLGICRTQTTAYNGLVEHTYEYD